MLKPYAPSLERPWNVARVVHLHRRAGFAATWPEIVRDLADGPEAAIERLLRPKAPPAAANSGEGADQFEADHFEIASQAIGDAAAAQGDICRLKAWWLHRMLFSPDRLGERLALMWHDHFATSYAKVKDVGLMRRQNDVFRKFARGPFGDLLPRALKEPATLVWLDAAANRKEHPNENLARESMELFALGVGRFSEADVKEASRALTGWTVAEREFRFDEERHDDGIKTIFGKPGAWNGDDFWQLLVEHPAAPHRLAARLAGLFMGEGQVASVVNDLAAGLAERRLDVGWGVENLLRSEAFFASGNLGNRVQGPIESAVGAVRALEMLEPPPSTLRLAEATSQMGQDLFLPPNVFGWPGGRSWLTSRTLVARANFAARLTSGKFHLPNRALDAAALAARHGFIGAEEGGAFYAQLLLGRPELPARLRPLVRDPNRLVASLLASPEAQLA